MIRGAWRRQLGRRVRGRDVGGWRRCCQWPWRWCAALAFGLVHGFGVASALGDRGASAPGLVTTLIAFNLGVEVGQRAVVVTLLPLA